MTDLEKARDDYDAAMVEACAKFDVFKRLEGAQPAEVNAVDAYDAVKVAVRACGHEEIDTACELCLQHRMFDESFQTAVDAKNAIKVAVNAAILFEREATLKALDAARSRGNIVTQPGLIVACNIVACNIVRARMAD